MSKRLKTAKISPRIEDHEESTPQILTPEDKLRVFVNIAIDRVLLDLKKGKLNHIVKQSETKNG